MLDSGVTVVELELEGSVIVVEGTVISGEGMTMSGISGSREES